MLQFADRNDGERREFERGRAGADFHLPGLQGPAPGRTMLLKGLFAAFSI